MTAAPGGTLPAKPVKPAQAAESGQGTGAAGWQGARLRAAIDRLHAAQLAALAPPEMEPPARRDAHRAQREARAQVNEMGTLLVRLARQGREDEADGEEAVAIRLRLVRLAVAAAITLAELVGLAFEIESPADRACCEPGSLVVR
jgi:hypothetical protein